MITLEFKFEPDYHFGILKVHLASIKIVQKYSHEHDKKMSKSDIHHTNKIEIIYSLKIEILIYLMMSSSGPFCVKEGTTNGN